MTPATRIFVTETDNEDGGTTIGTRAAVTTDRLAELGQDVPDERVAIAETVTFIPVKTSRKHTRGVAAEGTVIDEDGKERMVEGVLQDGASVVLLVQETKDGKIETRGALEEAKVQERLSRFAEKAGQLPADGQREQSPQDRAKLERLRELKEQAKAEFEAGADKSRANVTDEDRARRDEAKRAVVERERQKVEEALRKEEERQKAEEGQKKEEEQKRQAEQEPPSRDEAGKGSPPPDGGKAVYSRSSFSTARKAS